MAAPTVIYIRGSYTSQIKFAVLNCGACGTYGGRERCAQGFGGKTEGKRQWGDQDVDGRIILRWIFRQWEGVVGT